MQKFQSVQMNNGSILEDKKIGELTEYIIAKFSEEKLSYDEANIILQQVKNTIGECSQVQAMV